MTIEMVLNELSLRARAVDVYAARERMANFVDTLQAATATGVGRVLRTAEDFHDTVLAPDYMLARWRNDPEVDRECRRYVLTLTTKAPHLADLTPGELAGEPALFDFGYEGARADGLAAAFLTDALAVSLLSEARWDTTALQLEVTHLDDNAMTVTRFEAIHHASRRAHVVQHGAWIGERIRAGIRDGTDLWSRRIDLLPSLVFCESVRAQLEGLRSGNPLLRSVRDRLFEFQEYCGTWNSGPFEGRRLPTRVSPESQATLNQYGAERTFLCPDCQERVFSLHARVTPGSWRIHFIPLADEHRVLIGYIGPHLPTANDPT
ncbi:MAG TPA: hypothetical protein VGS20_09460 [Candidatus Acidoferrales bacterium]|nr:hypothetical protein [Candidatus Acidoferrales bacterium]